MARLIRTKVYMDYACQSLFQRRLLWSVRVRDVVKVLQRKAFSNKTGEMTDTNLSCVLHGVQDLRMEESPVRDPNPSEVQISVRSVGICGSDIKFWQKGALGHYVVTSPIVIGHESSGVVNKVGEDVAHLKVGDRVAIEPNQPCGGCDMCKLGHYNMCRKLKYLGTPPTDGCMRRLYCHPASFVYKLPDNVSFDEGALAQPLALGFYACARAGVTVGDYVIVSGAGPLGMSIVLAAKARGASKILVTDVIKDRLDYTSKIGADVTLDIKEEETVEELSKRSVRALGREADIVIECSGHPLSIRNAIHSSKVRGVVVQVGFGVPMVEIPLVMATLKELDIRGLTRICNNYPAVIEAIASGQVNVKQLVTHRFPLERAMDALTAAYNRTGVKIIIDCSRH